MGNCALCSHFMQLHSCTDSAQCTLGCHCECIWTLNLVYKNCSARVILRTDLVARFTLISQNWFLFNLYDLSTEIRRKMRTHIQGDQWEQRIHFSLLVSMDDVLHRAHSNEHCLSFEIYRHTQHTQLTRRNISITHHFYITIATLIPHLNYVYYNYYIEAFTLQYSRHVCVCVCVRIYFYLLPLHTHSIEHLTLPIKKHNILLFFF